MYVHTYVCTECVYCPTCLVSYVRMYVRTCTPILHFLSEVHMYLLSVLVDIVYVHELGTE